MNQRPPGSYANPYLAGVGLGLVLLAAFVIMGRGLGASGAFSSTVSWLTSLVAPEYAARNEPIPWVRVWKMPEFTYFPHKAHVRAGGGRVRRPSHNRGGKRTRRRSLPPLREPSAPLFSRSPAPSRGHQRSPCSSPFLGNYAKNLAFWA